MKDVRLVLFARREAEAVEASVGERAVVVAGFVAHHGGNGFDAHAEFIVSERLKERKSFGDQAANFGQEIGVAGVRKLGGFLFRGQTREIVFLFGVDAGDVFANGLGERSVGEKFGPRSGVHAGEEAIFAKGFLGEEGGGAHAGIEFLVVGFVESFGSNADLADERLGNVAVIAGGIERLRAAVAENHAAAGLKFVALGVASEVVVIV